MLQLRTIIFENIAEVSPSSCELEVAKYEKNTIAELQLGTNISLKSCGIAIAEVFPSSCGIAIADLKKIAHANLCYFYNL
jgi:hypothetical protein